MSIGLALGFVIIFLEVFLYLPDRPVIHVEPDRPTDLKIVQNFVKRSINNGLTYISLQH